jgi:hypothetical protein
MFCMLFYQILVQFKLEEDKQLLRKLKLQNIGKSSFIPVLRNKNNSVDNIAIAYS